MKKKILTIIIPTYNRRFNLEILLRSLKEELRPIEDYITIYVSDNASTDNTFSLLEHLSTNWPSLTIHRHPTNLDADKNFIHCVNQVQTRWFWLLGDDDLPKSGVVTQIVEILIHQKPALVYLESEWMNPVENSNQGEAVNTLNISKLDANSFASEVNTWLTFISGMLIDRNRLSSLIAANQLDRFEGTSLAQLGWVLPLLNTDGPFIFVKSKCILATSDNTGGYSAIKTFALYFPNIIEEFFNENQSVRKAILDKHINNYLPNLIWIIRFNNKLKFSSESSGNNTSKILRKYPSYWFFIWPVINLNKNFAWPFYATFRLISKIKQITFINK